MVELEKTVIMGENIHEEADMKKALASMTREEIDAYKEFAKDRLGFEFKDISLLIAALTHRSYVNEHRDTPMEHNERLEFLGDAILELVVSDFLYKNYYLPEGIMTSWRSALVRTESIGEAGEVLGYGPLVRLSHGESMNSERARLVIMADCFEAVLGATYVDQSYNTAARIIKQFIFPRLDQIIEDGSWRDPKSFFQEICQHVDGVIPSYRLLRAEGPDHAKLFTIAVYVGKELRGIGEGYSKQEAQSIAATKAIKKYRKDHPDFAPATFLEELHNYHVTKRK